MCRPHEPDMFHSTSFSELCSISFRKKMKIRSGAYHAPLMKSSQTYVFGSTHIDVGGCSYYRILFISQLLSQIYDHALFNDARLLFNNESLFPFLSSFRLQRACSVSNLKWFREVLLPAKRKYGFPVIYEIDDILVQEDIPVYNC